jgi:hypothetical protein
MLQSSLPLHVLNLIHDISLDHGHTTYTHPSVDSTKNKYTELVMWITFKSANKWHWREPFLNGCPLYIG